jgi:CHASE1-domain containing sensor protein
LMASPQLASLINLLLPLAMAGSCKTARLERRMFHFERTASAHEERLSSS